MNSFASIAVPPVQALCDSRGQLDPQAVGWSSRPLVNCALPARFGRRKRWNNWCITTPQWMLVLTFADLDYIGYGAVHFIDLQSNCFDSRAKMRLFGRGCHLPDNANESHGFEHADLQLRAEDHDGLIRLTGMAANICGEPLQIALDIQRPAHLESINLICPMGKDTFHACSRQLGLPVSGGLQLGQRTFACPVGHSFASLDFGRGVWPLNSGWTRAAFAAPGGIAGNFGAGWTDYSGLSENALWFGGELCHLAEPVRLVQPSNDPLAPWHLTCPSQSVDLAFTPRQQLQSTPRLGPLHADIRQWFGHFEGVLRSPDGERVPVVNASGWLGATQARW
ncbi:DUF2804 domain-containing protein [Pseudomonas sp. LRF_L74]|uniref:DUF2804 domain-containing protein n=1 Tax=Pseudomonas sp. LRF_L74 TaxID=3369422 RepID=UPI003F5F53D4